MQVKYKKLLIMNGSIIIILIALLISVNLFNSKHLDNNNYNQEEAKNITIMEQETITDGKSIQIPDSFKDEGVSINSIDASEGEKSINFKPDDSDSTIYEYSNANISINN